MKKAVTAALIVVLLALFVWALGCGTQKTTTIDSGETSQQGGDDYLEPGPRYAPYTPREGELVTPSDYDLGVQEGYEAGYWAGLADGRRGYYDGEPGGYDDSNEYYVEGYLEGYAEGYEDGYKDGQEM